MIRVFLAHSHDRDRDLVTALRERLLQTRGVELLDPVGIGGFGAEVASAIRAQIENCDVCVSIVGVDRPNILLETGMAMGAGKDLLLVASSPDPLPLNLRAIPVVLLSGDPEADSTAIAHRLLQMAPALPERDTERTSTLAQLETHGGDSRFVDSISPQQFEKLVAALFKQRGFEVAQTSRTMDAGYDLILRSPSDQRRIVVQIKKYSRQSRVSIAQVRELIGAAFLVDADRAVLVTSSEFTAGAQALAAGTTKPRLELVTLERLLDSRDIRDLWREGDDASALE